MRELRVLSNIKFPKSRSGFKRSERRRERDRKISK